MHKFTWWNPHLPQTLILPVAYGYLDVVVALILRQSNGLVTGTVAMLITLAAGVGAFGTVNLRIWGYAMSVAAAIGQFVWDFFFYIQHHATAGDYFHDLLTGQNLIWSLIRIAIVVMLLHPMSTHYVKSHFEKTIP